MSTKRTARLGHGSCFPLLRMTVSRERNEELATRTTDEVLRDHLECRKREALDEDLERNYTPDAVYLSMYGRMQGREKIREMAAMLATQLPRGQFEYPIILTEDEMGYVRWTGMSEATRIDDGVDSYLVRDGRIVVQTIHYTVKPR